MKKKLAFMMTTVIVAALSAAAQQVSTKYDHSYDFSKAKSFAVKVSPNWDSPTTQAYAERAVARELVAKGWTQAPDESSADVLVVLKGSAEHKKVRESFYGGTSGDPDGYSGPAGVSNTRMIEENVGQRAVNIFDNKTHAKIFTGVAVDEISPQDKKNEQKISREVKEIFKDFPPKTGK